MGHLWGQQLVISLQHISEEMMEVCRITTLRYLKFCKTWHARLLRCMAFRHVTFQCACGMSEICSLTDEDTIPAWTCVLRGDSRKADVSQCPVRCEALIGFEVDSCNPLANSPGLRETWSLCPGNPPNEERLQLLSLGTLNLIEAHSSQSLSI